MKTNSKFTIGLMFVLVSLVVLFSFSEAFTLSDAADKGGTDTIGPIVEKTPPINHQLVLELEQLARAELIDQLSLEDGSYEMNVQDIRLAESSALVEMRVITQSELVGEIDEVINVYALIDDSNIVAVFREPSPKFHIYAAQVSPALLPPERLAFWREVRQSEATQLERGGTQALYRMPFDGGTQRPTAQDYDKHFDFAGEGFQIRAARSGTTYVKRASANNGGCAPSFIPYDNYVRVTHQDGTYAYYLHQQYNSIPDFSGGTVTQGQCLGRAGNTGYACGAHLHFNVTTTSDNSGEPGSWKVPDFVEGMPQSGVLSPVSQNSNSACGQSSDVIIVNPPPISPSPGTCGNGWHQIVGYNGQPAYTTRNAQVAGSTSTNSATWVPNIGKTGTYAVEAYIPNHTTAFCNITVSYDTEKAAYKLTDSNNNSFTTIVNQKPWANVWVYLGDLYCNVGQSCNAKLTDLTGEAFLSHTVSFSAVRFTLKSTPPPPPPTYSISGNVSTASGTGLGSIDISVGGKTVKTDSNGNYAVGDLQAGTHVVTPAAAGYTFSPANKSVTLGPNATGINFTASPVTFSIKGRVSDSASGLAITGATVSTGDKSAQTDANGNYTLTELTSGTYTVSVSKSGYGFSPPTRSVTLGPDANGVDFTGTTTTYSIKGTVTAGGNAQAEVSINAGGKTALTDSNGNYAISGLAAGTYTVKPGKAGYSFSPDSRSVTVGPDALNIDFIGSEMPVDGARLFISPATQTVGLGGGQFCVQVRVEKTPELHAFEFALDFPADLLEGKSATLGAFLSSSGREALPLGPEIDNAAGEIRFGAYTVGNNPGPAGAGELATVCFMPEKAGTAELALTVGKLSGPNGTAIPASLASGSVNITSCYFADFDCDGEVEASDVQMVAGRWNKKAGDAGYDPKFDVALPSGEIDVIDVQKVASEWGWPDKPALPKSTGALAPLTFSIDPAEFEIKVGETRQIALKVTGAQDLGAFEIELNFNPALIRVNKVELTDFLESTGRQPVVLGPDIDNSAGIVHFGAATYGMQPGVTGDGQIVTIEVTALEVGDGELDLDSGRASNPAAEPMTVSLIDGSYQVSEVVTNDGYSVVMPVIFNRP